MSIETVETQIKDMLENNWALLGDLTVGSMHFDTGWFDAKLGRSLIPQVTVRHLFSPPLRFFGPSYGHIDLHYLSWDRYAINLWREYRHGQEGAQARLDISNMRDEVVRILNSQHKSYSPPLGLVIPLNRGIPLHEWDRSPRLLRYELLCQAVYKS